MNTSRRQSVRRVLSGVLLVNVAVATAKLVIGASTGSLSMVADGFHSVTDSASNVVGLVGISLAARPPDADHPYGHRKFETLSALCIGGLLALTAWEVLKSCIERLESASVPEITRWSFLVMAVTMILNVAVSIYERRRGEALGSEILNADAAHTRSDVYVSLGVVASLLGVWWGFPQLDLLAALVITGVIAGAAYRIVRESAGHLVDAAVVPAGEIRQIALAVAGVAGVHKIRTRGRLEDAQADLHVQVPADLRIGEAHRIGHEVADRLRADLGLRDVVVHVEPDTGRGIPGQTSRDEKATRSG